MTRTVAWGILSTALINGKLLAAARLSETTRVLAVASREGDRARSFAAEHGIERFYASYDELLDDAEVEAVYVPLPNGLHHEWTMRALDAGKHVLCEKPYSRYPEEVIEAFELAERRSLVLSEAYMYRYNPQSVKLAALVADGAIGELRFIDSAFTWPCDAPGHVRLSTELDGGSLVDVGCYCVSAARLLAGEPSSVTAQEIRGPTGVEVRMVGTMSFEDGVLAHFDSGFHLPDRSELEVVGADGRIRVSDPWHCLEPGLTLTRQGEDPEWVEVERANSYALELEAMATAIAGEPGPLLGREDALGQAETIKALYRAAGQGGLVMV